MCSAPTRRPASRRAVVNIPLCRPSRDGRSTSSTNTVVPALGPISRPGTFIAPSCSAAASARPALPPSNVWLIRSCANNLIGQARRVFWIVDNGSSHRGERAAARLRAKWPNLILVHTPVHASWLNQIEVYFSIVQRKLLTPNDFASLAVLEDQLMQFQQRYQRSAKPFEWTFTRRDLDGLLAKLRQKSSRLAA